MDKTTVELLQHHIKDGETPEQAAERIKKAYAEIEKCFLCGKDRNGAPNLLYDRFTKKFFGICGHCARMR